MPIVGNIVTEISNPVVYCKHFNQMIQKENEMIQDTNRCMYAMDCAFVCPNDAMHELIDYHRIRIGIFDSNMKLSPLYPHTTYKKQKQKEAQMKHQPKKTCIDCGCPHGAKKECLVKDKHCLRCSKKGHFSSVGQKL